MRRLFITLSLLLLLVSTLSATDKVCRTCGKGVSKTHISAQGYYFHPNHFTCDHCSETIGQSRYYFDDDRFYHTSCYEKINELFCAHCTKNIVGRYVDFNGKRYHQRCYTKNIALKCSLCGGILNGPYILDHRGNKYHADHNNVHPQCYYCKQFIGTNGVEGFENSSGQNLCGQCMKNAVDTEDELKQVFEQANSILQEYGLDVDLEKISLKLGDKKKISKLFGARSEKNLMGFTYFEKTSSLFGLLQDQQIVIYLLDGMPYMWAINAAAHEINHAWQFNRNIHNKDLDYCEGSANYCSFLILENQIDRQFAKQLIEQLIEEDDPNYGEGFRRVKYIVDHNGIEYWKDHLAHNKSFPEGY